MQKKAGFGTLDPHRRDLCAAVLALCAPDFAEKPASAQEFLAALYQKLCAQMFPDGLPEVPVLTADETAYLSALEAAFYGPADSFDPYLDLLPLPEDAISGSRVEVQYARFEQAVRESHLMAVMRLGITDSGRIAGFLNCASATVYTYRTKLRNSALGSRSDFENRIRHIGL